MKPFHTFRLCIVTALLLSLFSFIYPKNGISVFNCHLDFMSLRDLFAPEKVEYADISKIIADTLAADNADTASHVIVNDSMKIQHNETSIRLFKKFYEKISNAERAGYLVRVLHYGDSQIEADRISGTLREKLQKKFGGSGVGIIPVSEVSEARSNVFISKDNWLREDANDRKNKGKNAAECGLLCSVCRPRDEGKDSWVKIIMNKQSPELQKKVNHVKVLCTAGMHYSVKIDTNRIEQLFAPDSMPFSVCDLKTKTTNLSEIRLQFSSREKASVYGIALDGESGVTVDNVSLRGSSGIEFTSMDSALLRKQMEELNVGMIVLQFGVNVVPYVIKDYSYYEKQFSSQLALFRKIAPDAAILVIGVSDMSRREKGIYVSYPNIEKIRLAMKNAAFDNGCAYWDLYEVMGGKNSMPSWVKAKPSLANKDYTHFNNQGAAIVGTKLYDAILEDFDKLLEKKKSEILAQNKK